MSLPEPPPSQSADGEAAVYVELSRAVPLWVAWERAADPKAAAAGAAKWCSKFGTSGSLSSGRPGQPIGSLVTFTSDGIRLSELGLAPHSGVWVCDIACQQATDRDGAFVGVQVLDRLIPPAERRDQRHSGLDQMQSCHSYPGNNPRSFGWRAAGAFITNGEDEERGKPGWRPNDLLRLTLDTSTGVLKLGKTTYNTAVIVRTASRRPPFPPSAR